MSGHNPFQRLVDELPVERKQAIEQRKKAALVEVELREALESTIANWQIDPSTTSNGLPSASAIERVDTCLNYLRQAVKNLGGELVVTAKFPDGAELSIDSFQPKAEVSQSN